MLAPPQESADSTSTPLPHVAHDHTGEAGVGHHEVGAAAQDEHRLARLVGGADDVDERLRGVGLDVAARPGRPGAAS